MMLPRIKTALLEARTRVCLAWRALTTSHWDRAAQSVQAELRRRNELEWQYSRGYLAGWRESCGYQNWAALVDECFEQEISSLEKSCVQNWAMGYNLIAVWSRNGVNLVAGSQR